MIKIPVIKKTDNGNSIYLLVPNDILLVKAYKGDNLFFTEEGTFHQIINFSDWLLFLQQFNFETFDRGSVVNLDKIKYYDPYLMRLFFSDDITKNSLFATVSLSNKRKLEYILREKNEFK